MANEDLGAKLKAALLGPLLKAMDNFQKQLNKGTLNEFKDLVKDQIQKGISPVDTVGRFQKYSDSYREAIKKGSGEAKEKHGKLSPVDMTLTGAMLDSLEIVQSGKSTFIQMDDPKAYYHNNSGAGKKRVIRRLLPDSDGEKFNTVLQRKFISIVKQIVKNTKIR